MSRRAFTLIELLVVIAIIAILAAILFPVFARAREKARQISCISGLKQVGLAVMQYVQDYDECMPHDPCAANIGCSSNGIANGDVLASPLRWTFRVQPYMKNVALFRCPSSAPVGAGPNHMGFWTNGTVFAAANGGSTSLAMFPAPADIVMLYDDIGKQNRTSITFRPYWLNGNFSDGNAFDTISSGTWRNGPHNDIINVAWADGHVKALKNRALKDYASTRRVYP